MNRGYKRLSRLLGLAIMLLAAPIFILSLGLLFEQSRTLIHHEVSDYISSTLNTAVQRVCYYMNTVETDAKPTNFRHMANMLSEGEQPYQHAYYVLLDGDGRYLIHPDSTRLFRKTIFTDADPCVDMDIITVGHEMTAGKQGTVHIRRSGERYHMCYRQVPGTNWSLALVCPENEAMKDLNRLGYVIIVLLVIGLLLILLFCNHAVKQIISPIHQLIDTTQKMEDGQFDEIVPQSSHDNTVGRLQNSFRKMQQALNERMDSLQQQADTIRRQNEELQQTKQQAEETVRQKSRFVKHVIQQMRMPLNVITGFADVLGGSNAEEITITEEELSSIMYLMTSNTINMNRMVLLLLDASETDATGRLSCTRTEEVSCNEISRDVIDHIVRHFPQASIRFETELQDCVQILTNRMFLLSVLVEPLYNAVLHSDGEHITLRVSQTATTVRFTVQDTGPGLPPEMPEPVFKPFREIDNLLIGTGIGLSLARRYAIGLGGSLIFDTDYHQGCSLAIELPK